MGISRLKPRYTNSHSLVIKPPRTHSKMNTSTNTMQTPVEAAFFLGKLNKKHDREQIYNALRALSKRHRFYITKLDMPYGDNRSKRGNKGYCFVHCKSQEQVDRVVALKFVQLGSQKCEVKPYAGRGVDSNVTSGYSTPSQQSAMNTEMHQKQREQLLKKCLRLSQKSKRKPTWAEESDEPEAYYDDSDVFSDDDDISVSDESLEDTLDAEQVSDFLQSSIVNASKDGKALEFLQAYFEAYETILQQVQEYSPEQLDSLSKKYAAVVQ